MCATVSWVFIHASDLYALTKLVATLSQLTEMHTHSNKTVSSKE